MATKTANAHKSYAPVRNSVTGDTKTMRYDLIPAYIDANPEWERISRNAYYGRKPGKGGGTGPVVSKNALQTTKQVMETLMGADKYDLTSAQIIDGARATRTVSAAYVKAVAAEAFHDRHAQVLAALEEAETSVVEPDEETMTLALTGAVEVNTSGTESSESLFESVTIAARAEGRAQFAVLAGTTLAQYQATVARLRDIANRKVVVKQKTEAELEIQRQMAELKARLAQVRGTTPRVRAPKATPEAAPAAAPVETVIVTDAAGEPEEAEIVEQEVAAPAPKARKSRKVA